jgi:hypothetical protein
MYRVSRAPEAARLSAYSTPFFVENESTTLILQV